MERENENPQRMNHPCFEERFASPRPLKLYRICVRNLPIECRPNSIYKYLPRFGSFELAYEPIFQTGNVHPTTAIGYLKTDEDSFKYVLRALSNISGSVVEYNLVPSSDSSIHTQQFTKEKKVFIRVEKRDELSENYLAVHFRQFGKIQSIEIPRNHIDKTSKGIAFVTFERFEDYQKCIAHKKHSIKGRQIKCRPYRSNTHFIEDEKRALFLNHKSTTIKDGVSFDNFNLSVGPHSDSRKSHGLFEIYKTLDLDAYPLSTSSLHRIMSPQSKMNGSYQLSESLNSRLKSLPELCDRAGNVDSYSSPPSMGNDGLLGKIGSRPSFGTMLNTINSKNMSEAFSLRYEISISYFVIPGYL